MLTSHPGSDHLSILRLGVIFVVAAFGLARATLNIVALP